MSDKQKNEKTIFRAALKLKTAAERIAYIDKICRDDLALKTRIMALLHAHDDKGDFLEGLIEDSNITLDESPLTEGPGTKIGSYKLLQLIGEGGFGVVYMAEQESPIRRRVALKIIKLGMDTKQVIARFEAERQALAMMDHPNIARVFDAGTTETGRPYFVMELVKGIPITEYCDKNNLDTSQRLKLFIDVCKAVQHAHQKGIIHRDIKPSNVMITLHDGKPVPKIIDFGIAKATQHRLTEKTLFTEFKQFIGTPEYMSPEQAEMSGLDVDTRSDIYSLGVLLYELLTGTTPFEAEQLRRAAYDEMRRIIREDEPPRPSMRLSTLGDALTDIAKHRHVQPGELCRIIHGDLDWIVMKTLEKDRTRRYESANVLAMDIERHLADEPVIASPPSQVYRLRKFVRRNRVPVMTTATIIAVILAGFIVSTVMYLRSEKMYFQAEQARQEEATAREQADEAQGIAETLRKKEAAARIEAQEAEKLAEQQRQQSQHLLAKAQFERGIRLLNEGNQLGLQDLLDAWETAKDSPSLRASIGRLWAIAHDLSAGRLISILPGSPIRSLSPDGKLLVTFSGRTAQLWEMGTWQPHGPPLQLEKNISSVQFSPDSRLLVTHSMEGVSRLWDTATGQPFGPILQHDLGNIRRDERDKLIDFSSDGKFLATGYLDNTVRLWDTATGQAYGKIIRHNLLQSLSFSPDRNLIATGGLDMSAQLWEVDTGQPYGPPMNSGSSIWYVLFSPDGKLLATKEGTSFDIYLWDTETGQLYNKLQNAFWMNDMEFSPDGTLLAAGSWDWTTPIWDVATGKLIGRTTPHHTPVNNIAFSSDGKLLATNSLGDNTIRLWDVAAGEPYGSQLHCPQGSGILSFSPDNEFLMSPGNRIWWARQLLNTEEVPHRVITEYSAFSPDGKIGAITTGNIVQLWDTATKQALGEPLEHKYPVSKVAFSPDGKILACSYGGFYPIPGASASTGHYGIGYIRLWEVPAGRLVGPILETGRYVYSLTFSPDGKLLAGGTLGSDAELFDMTTFQRVQAFRCAGIVDAVAFSPNCKMLAAGTDSGNVELWDITTGEKMGSPIIHRSGVMSVAFSPDGNLLATVSGYERQTVRIWDIGSVLPYQSLALTRLAMRGVDVLRSFSSHGTILVSKYGEAWRLPPIPTDLRQMQLKTWIALGARRNPQGEVISIRSDQWQSLRQELARKLPASKPHFIDVPSSLGSSAVTLAWIPNSDAVAHNVYFGTDPNKLELLGTVKEASYENVPELDMDKTYCWRIDTVKSNGSVIKGDRWTSRTGKLVGWWKLDENSGGIVHDSSGNNNHGTLEQVGPPIWQDIGGRKRGALQFDGVDDYVDCGNDASLNITDAITLALWVKTVDCSNGDDNPYVTKGDRSYAIKHSQTNSIEFFIYDRDWHTVWYPVDSSFNDDWHHLAGTFDGSQVKLYIDGALVAETPCSGSIAVNTFNVNIGRNSEWIDRVYNGLIDDVAIFNRALNDTEIIQLMERSGSSFMSDPNLVTLWELDESNGTTASDSTNNGIDGSLRPGGEDESEMVTGPQWIDGKIGGALTFDGEDDYVSLPIGPLLSKLDRATIMLWVNFSNEGGPWQRIFDFGVSDSAGYMFLTPRAASDGPLHFAITLANFGAETIVEAADALPSGWHHVAVVIERDHLQLFLDGELVGRTEGIYTLSDLGVTTNNWLGRSQYSVDAFFKGSMDDVRIYSYPLQKADVATVYASQELNLSDKPKWFFEVNSEESLQSDTQVDETSAYYVSLASENPEDEELVYQSQDLGIVCDVLAGLERLDPNNIDRQVFYRCALAHLGMGDEEGYHKRCAQMLERFSQTQNAETAYWVAWTCVLAPDAVENLEKVIKLAEFSVEKNDKSDHNHCTLGAIFFRAGRFEEALKKLTELSNTWKQAGDYPATDNTSPAYTWFFLAMVHHQLGSSDEAKYWFDKAIQWSQEELQNAPAWNRRLTLQLLQAEARSLLGISEDNSSSKKKTESGKNN